MSFSRSSIAGALAAAIALGGCASEPTAPPSLWVADNYVQCNQFDEPYRECLLVSHGEFEPYRHLEGGIEGFDYAEGTKYELEVEPSDLPGVEWRLVQIISTD